MPTTAAARRCSRCSEPLRERRDIVLVDARGTGRRDASATGPTPTARAPPPAISRRCATSSAPGISSSTPRATERASRSLRRALRRPAARAGTRRRPGRDALRRRRPRRGARARQGPRLRRAGVARLAARLRTRPLRVHGRIDDDALARAVVRADARSLAELPAAATAALEGDGVPLARLVARTAAPRRAQAAQARASNCHDDAPPAASAAVDGGPFTGATWLRALGLAACKGWPQPATARSGLPAGAALGGAPALVLAGELGVGAPTATLAQGGGPLPRRAPTCAFAGRRAARAERPGGCAGGSRARSWRGAEGEPGLREPACALARRDRLPGEPRVGPRCAARRQGARARPLDARRPARGHRRGAGRGRRAGRRRGGAAAPAS